MTNSNILKIQYQPVSTSKDSSYDAIVLCKQFWHG